MEIYWKLTNTSEMNKMNFDHKTREKYTTVTKIEYGRHKKGQKYSESRSDVSFNNNMALINAMIMIWREIIDM